MHMQQTAHQKQKFLNVKFSCLLKIICVKAKNLDRIDICLAEKLKSVIMATKCFHLATSSYNEW